MSESGSRLGSLSADERAVLFQRFQEKKRREGRLPEGAERGSVAEASISRRPPGSPLPPLSFSQQRLWFIDRLRPGDAAYNIPAAMWMRGPFQAQALGQAFNALVARHEALRTTFAMPDEQPVQIIAPRLEIPVPVIDLSEPRLGADRVAAEVRRLADEEALAPFDLESGPLVRVRLLRVSSERHRILLTMHHIVSDGWSMGVLLRELMAFYSGFSTGRETVLPELPVQYADFAVWQREWLTQERLAEHLDYWRRQLAGLPESLPLPHDRSRSAFETAPGAILLFWIEENPVRGLQVLAREAESTLFIVLLAAFQALLGRWTSQEDLAVGSPIANRSRREISGLIGFFVNTLVLRGDLSGDPPFRELVRRVRRVALDAYAHQDVPFERLVEELRPERSPDHTPLFQVMFALQNAPLSDIDMAGQELEPEELAAGGSEFDLSLSLQEVGSRVLGELQIDSLRFFRTTGERLIEHFQNLLAAIADNPDLRLSELPLLGAAERAQILREWNDTRREDPDVPLHRLVEATAATRPEAPAVLSAAGESLTYRELLSRSTALARHLRSLGVGPEARVGLLADRSPSLVVGLLAVLQSGGAYLPLDPAHPPERLSLMVDDAKVRVLLAHRETRERITWDPGPDVRVVDLNPPEDLAGLAGSASLPEINPGSAAYVIYTSGSTGRPKGVVVSHRSVAWYIRSAADLSGLDTADRVLQFSSLGFDSSVEEIWGPLVAGGTLVLRSDAMAESVPIFLRELRRLGVTVMVLPTAFWHEVAASLEEMGEPLSSSMRLVILGGEEAQAQRIAAWKRQVGNRVGLMNSYGPTEVTVACTFHNLASWRPGEEVPIGRPMSGVRVYPASPDMRLVAVGAWGELLVGSAGLARGYLSRPDLTAERFVPDPWNGEPGARLYRTGDRVRFRPDGALQFGGRVDAQVKVRGFRVEPGEIEAALITHPSVREAAVMARRIAGQGSLLAGVVPEAGAQIDIETLRRFLAESLPPPLVPSTFVLLSELPLTPNGKVDRAALARLEASEAPMESGAPAAPRTPVEEVLAGLWAEVLGVERVGRDQSFFDLGGHSLAATRLVSRLRAALGIELPLRALFEAPSIGALAERFVEPALAERKENEGPPPLRPRPVGEAPALSFGQERLWFLDRLEPGTTTLNMGTSLRLRGPLHVAALEQSLNEIVRRHESLRSTFREEAGRPAVSVEPNLRISLPVADLSGLPEPAREDEAERIARAELSISFDLEKGPLLRVRLLRLAADLHAMLLDVHHIVSDGWSMAVLDRELIELYAAFSQGRPSPLPELPVQYGDFARWQRDWLRGEVLESQLAWWRRTLGGSPAPLDLPTDRPRPAAQTFRGEVLPLRLGEALGRDLLALSRREGASLFMTLLAGFKVLLHRWSGQEEIVVGAPIAGRRQIETEGLIGFFLNTLALRTDLGGAPSFRELLVRVREVTLGAYAHQDVPFEALLNDLQPERDLSRTPLFQVFFNMLNLAAAGESARLPDGLEVEAGTTPEPPSKFDLTFYVAEDGEGIRIDLVYNAGLFDRVRMEELLAQYALLLEQVVARPEASIRACSLVTPRAMALLPDPTSPLGGEWIDAVHELFAERARRHPERPAVEDADGTWTYGELAEAAARLAAWLRQRGLERGDRVAVWAHRSAPVAWAVLGILEAGGAFVMLDPSYPPARVVDVLRLAEPRAWLALEAAGDPGMEIAGLLDELERSGTLLGKLTLPGGGPGGAAATLAALPVAGPAAPVGPDDIAYVAFTSGSTGTPKGILGRHGPLSHFLPWICERFGLGESDRYTMLSGLAHDPLQRDLFTPLCTGATLCVPSPDDLAIPGRLAVWAARQGVTVTHLTPAMGQLLTEVPRDVGEPVQVPSLRWALLVGEALTRLDVDRLRRLAPGATCVNLYGSTETQRAVAYHQIEGDGTAGERARQVLPLGRGMKDVQLLVLNVAGGLAGIGEVGEIRMRSPHLSAGYLADATLTRDRFLVNPFTGQEGDRLYLTGDLGRYLPNGEAAFAGRADQQVKIRGFRIEPAEIQAAIGGERGVRDSVVIAREDGGDRYLAAYVVRDPAAGVDPLPGLRSALARRLPDYMVPAVFVELPALPLTPNGKLDRRALPLPDRPIATLTMPRTPAEEALAEIWAEVLRRDRVGIHEDFFELGGHSLLAALVAARVREALGVELPLRALFEARTVAGLAERIEEAWRSWDSRLPAPPPLRPLPRPVQGKLDLPLSFSQERLWFLDRLDPANPAYNMPAAVRLRGRLDVAALSSSLSEIVRRHEALRTTFRETEDGTPVQVIHPAARLPLPRVDLTGLPAAVREDEAQRLATEHARLPFDLQRGPLVRARLLRLGTEEHAVLWATHHIVSDGWSLAAVFVRELALLYEAFAQERPSPLSELPIQYGDWAAWQRSWLRGEVLEAQLGWWRERLAGAPTALELVTDRPRRPLRAVLGGTRPWSFSAGETRSLHAFANEGGATLFMVLHAGLAALLGRWSGQRDVLVGTPVANRSRTEIEGLIGFFVNTLVLRGDLSGQPDLRALVARSRDAALGAYAHQDLPFERLVEELQPDRDLSRSPLFQVMLVLQNMPAERFELPGLALESLPVEGGTARFELTLSLAEGPEGLAGAFDYDAGLFDVATIDRLGEHLTALLRAGLAEPDRPIGLLPILSGSERLQLLREGEGWAEPSAVVPVEQLFLQRAAATPQAVAISFENRRISYAELRACAEELARRLRDLGVGPEVRVGILLERSPELIVAFLGVLLAGGAYVPIDPAYPAERISLLLEDAQPAVMVRERNGDLELLPIAPAAHLDCPSHGESDPKMAAYVIYTSGSTGRPKGVVVTRGALGSFALAMARRTGMRATDRMLLFLSPSFDAAGEAIYPTLVTGATLVMHRQPNTLSPAELAEICSRHGVTVLDLPGLVYREWLAAAVEIRFPLRAVMTGGESQPSEMVRGVAGWLLEDGLFVSSYGPTEATITATVTALNRAEAASFSAVVPLGRPLANVAVRLLDREMELVPQGVAGEICIAGAGLARGYLGRPDLTAAAFVPDPFDEPGARVYRTGDLARWRTDGSLEFLGRVDEQVKIRGFRVELGEVEAALAAHPAVREAAVVARAERGREKRLVAFVVLAGDAVAPDLRTWLGGRLPDFMVPSVVTSLEALPTTSTGKLDRRALAERDLGTAAEYEHLPPRDELELRLVRIWEEVLDVRPVGVRDDFFELGGHSLLTVRLAALVRSRIGVDLPLAALFQAPTVERMAGLLRAARGASERSVRVEIQPGSQGRCPLFLVHPIGGNVLAYVELARRLGVEQPVHGLQTPDDPPPTIELMADRYLDGIRREQPKGPYRLAGWSMGGLVAWEMARKLAMRGERVELLALIDTRARGGANPEADDAQLATRFAADLARTLGLEPPVDLEVGAEGVEGVLANALAAARESGVLPSGIEAEDLRRLFAFYRTNYRAMAAYEPGLYFGPVRLLRASEPEEADPTLGWSVLAQGGLQVAVIPGDHYSILRGEGAAGLAAQLADVLEHEEFSNHAMGQLYAAGPGGQE